MLQKRKKVLYSTRLIFFKLCTSIISAFIALTSEYHELLSTEKLQLFTCTIQYLYFSKTYLTAFFFLAMGTSQTSSAIFEKLAFYLKTVPLESIKAEGLGGGVSDDQIIWKIKGSVGGNIASSIRRM